jgi:hypothetical protein
MCIACSLYKRIAQNIFVNKQIVINRELWNDSPYYIKCLCGWWIMLILIANSCSLLETICRYFLHAVFSAITFLISFSSAK